MKILVISQYWAPENGVPQRRWSWLTKILIEAGHEVAVLAPPPHYLRQQSFQEWAQHRQKRQGDISEKGPSGETIIRSGYLPGGMSITQKVVNQVSVAFGGLKKVLSRNGAIHDFEPDVIIGTVPALPTAVVAYLASKRLRAPFIIDLRDAWPELLEYSNQWNASVGEVSFRQKLLSKGPLQLVIFLTDWVLRTVYRRAHSIIVTSADLADQLRNNGSKMPSIVTIRNVFPPETSVDRSQRNPSRMNSLNVLYAGTLGRAQNLENALLAASIAKDAGVDVNLRFVGAGAAREQLECTAIRLGLNAQFLVRQGADSLADHYLWADTALVHLTDWEPLSRAVPSKTYELMNQRVHISGVVDGETARLITELKAGDVVPPERPDLLAELWCALAKDTSSTQVSGDSAEWLTAERELNAPQALLGCVNRAKESAN